MILGETLHDTSRYSLTLNPIMGPLRFPRDAVSVLDRAHNGDARTSEFDKWLVYTTGVPPSNAEELSHAAMVCYNDQTLGEPESEWDTLAFLKPANQSHPNLQSPSLQRIFEHHLGMIERQLPGLEPESSDERNFYIFGFIAVTRPDWRGHGVTAVHCDKDRGKWKVTQCSGIPVDQLGMELTSVSDIDDDFDNVRQRYYNSGNDAEDNLGGPVPEGEWQFLVYCKGISQMKAAELIPDPRGGPDYRMGEGCLWFLQCDLPAEKIQGDFPVAYANAIRDPSVPATGGELSICRIHPSLFAVAHSEDLRSVSTVEIEWNHDIARSDSALRDVGQESQATTQICEPDLVVVTLQQLAIDR